MNIIVEQGVGSRKQGVALPANVVSRTPTQALKILSGPAARITCACNIQVRYTPHELWRGL